MALNQQTSTNQMEVIDPDKDEYYYLIKKRIYQASKDGFSVSLQNILNRVESMEIRNVLVNQVSLFQCQKKLSQEKFSDSQMR
jgi:hypothetical protein